MDKLKHLLFRASKYGAPLTSAVSAGEIAAILEKHADLGESVQNVHDRIEGMAPGAVFDLGDGITVERLGDEEEGCPEQAFSNKYEGR